MDLIVNKARVNFSDHAADSDVGRDLFSARVLILVD